MSQKYECDAILSCRIEAVIACILHRFRGNRLRNGCFIRIDHSGIVSQLSKQRLRNFYSFKLIPICLNRFHQFVILCPMH